MEMNDSILCRIDDYTVPIYVVLLVAALAVPVVPFVKDLASHGKTRTSIAGPATSNPTFISQLWSFAVDQLVVPKSFFTHFYIFAILSLYARQGLLGVLRGMNQVKALLFIHFMRRLLECTFVHQWRRGSYMHVSGYVVGILHYLFLPLVFFPCPQGVSNMDKRPIDEDSLVHQAFCFASTIACLWAQYQQSRHHWILAQLRRRSHTAAQEKVVFDRYQLPRKGWFTRLSCPHYSSEIVIYLGLASLSCMTDQSLSITRLVVLLLWVVGNLTVSAWESHQWYLRHFPMLEKPENRRWAIIPYCI